MTTTRYRAQHGQMCVACSRGTRERETIFGYVDVPICDACASDSRHFESQIITALRKAFK